MLLKRVIVENFGPFQGMHTLELVPPHPTGTHRPVTLIGGHNGSGKTSLLEAIRLCFHGRRILGSPRTNDYNNYLRKRIHQDSLGQRSRQSSVRVDIDAVEVGYKHTYEIIRSWRDAPDVLEDLEVRRNGEVLQELLVDQYQAFLDELMPLGLAEFFLFDGERIQKLAEEDGSDAVVADSIRVLLGLDLTSRLRADMAILIRSRDNSLPTGEIQADLETTQLLLKEVGAQIEKLEADHREADARIRNLERAVELQEQKIASEGGDFARKREGLSKEQTKWQATLESCETRLRELAGDLLPFCLVPELCEIVRQRLQDDAAARREEVAATILHSKQQEILRTLDSPDFWAETFGREPSEAVRDQIARAVSGLAKRIVADCGDQRPPPLHDVSERDRQALLTTIETVLTDLPRQAANLADAAEEAHERLLRVEQDIQRVPMEDVLTPLLKELSRLQTKLVDMRHGQMKIEAKLRRATAEREQSERIVRKLTERLYGMGQHSRAMSLATKVRKVLQSYEQELTLARVEHLSDCVTECYKQLGHKQSLCSRIQFDPKTLAVTLYNAQGEVVYRPLLSAGEKQILSIAILWGLGRASGRQLPVIIDTPLARLDVEHRNRLLSRYFPRASRQVILFCTDSEIDCEGLDVLRPSLARALHLRFDSEHERTAVEEGYFPVKEAVGEH